MGLVRVPVVAAGALALVAAAACEQNARIQQTANQYAGSLFVNWEKCGTTHDLIFLMLDSKQKVMRDTDPNFQSLPMGLSTAGGSVTLQIADTVTKDLNDAGVAPIGLTATALLFEDIGAAGQARDLVIAFDHGGSFSGLTPDDKFLNPPGVDGGLKTDPTNSRLSYAQLSLMSTTFLQESVTVELGAFPFIENNLLVGWSKLSNGFTNDSTTLQTQSSQLATGARGGSPIFYALTQAAADLRARGGSAQPVTVLVTDGRNGAIADGGAGADATTTQQNAVDALKKTTQQTGIGTIFVGMMSWIPSTDLVNSLDSTTLRAMACSLNAAANDGFSTYVEVADADGGTATDMSLKMAAVAELTKGRYKLSLTADTSGVAAGTYVVTGGVFVRPANMSDYTTCTTDTACSNSVTGNKCRLKGDSNALDGRCYMPFEVQVTK
ncbi:MAG: hypothetical protein HYY84_19550 [Deltaproteobacteria bacterium]|nr:hypothetical protein [Deltaproteobacteria bacterium]